MPVYIVTGKLGGGKSLVSVSRIKLYLDRGAKVATNLDLFLLPMFHRNARNLNVVRLPDKPKISDLESIGCGNDSYDESKNGLLVLDECATWFNSRTWNEKDRKPVNDWFLHARKLGWDVLLIIQNITILDSQARDAIAEHTVFCKRLDRFSVPLLSPLWKMLTGSRLPGPKIHVARVVYGISDDDPLVERWLTQGTRLHRCYDTKQAFRSDYPHGPYSLLTPWHLRGRYFTWSKEKIMQFARVMSRRYRSALILGAGVFVGMVGSLVAAPYMLASMQERAEALHSMPAELPVLATQPEVAQPQVDAIATESAPVEPTSLAGRFAGYRIAAFLANGSRKIYQVHGGNGETLTDDQLRALGYLVLPVSECELLVATTASLSEKTSIFAPGCVVKESGKQSDLSAMPYFQGTKQHITSLITRSPSNARTEP